VSSRGADRTAFLPRGAVSRTAVFLGFWVLLSGVKLTDLPVGAIAAVLATWASLRLIPPGVWRLQPLALAGLALRFVRQAIVAGVDVAWRAFDPRLPLRPGFVSYRVRCPDGPARSTFCTLTSLLPGTVPCGTQADGTLLVHCLDVRQPVVAQLEEEDARLARVLGVGLDDV
jgi:multicomponent Na+:H+ antiporter subunit E